MPKTIFLWLLTVLSLGLLKTPQIQTVQQPIHLDKASSQMGHRMQEDIQAREAVKAADFERML